VTARLIPILGESAANAPVARWQGQLISREHFLAHVRWVAEQLPEARFAVNLCEDRYLFMVAFAAVVCRGFTNLLPPSRAALILAEVVEEFEPSICLVDQQPAGLPSGRFVMPDLHEVQLGNCAVPMVSAHHPAAILFTSGSTGGPSAHWKYWGNLVQGAASLQQRFGIKPGSEIIATVPPQHMFGLELSVLLPLVGGVLANSARPFFPADICRSLQQALQPRILVTTPVHLRACVGAGLRWAAPASVISATAPLSFELAHAAEEALHAPVLEVFGSTETGSIASRRTVAGGLWRLYETLRIDAEGSTATVSGGHLSAPVVLNDHVRIGDASSFELLGRQSDLVNIAGKRASLADLNEKLLQIEGVLDGVFVPPDPEEGGVARLTALVVAPGLNKEAVLSALAQRIDPAFIPRPLHMVDRLPRNETGKLARGMLASLLESSGRGS
jgi:acyl-coenzyme A synthetase/AMP-(fatty) acid ligase